MIKLARAVGLCSAALLSSIVGCGGSEAPRDGAPPGTDAPIAAPETANITVSGARSASLVWDGDANYISCLTDASGFFSVSASNFAGGTEDLGFSFNNYTGPGTYDFTYSTGGGGPSSTLRLSGGYNYWFFFNRSSVDFSTVNATCTLVVAAPGGSTTRIDVTLTCSNYVANISSPDYADMSAAGFRPSVSFSALLSCDI